jgi:hypothetical protein
LFGLIWLAESTAGWFFVREKYCWLANLVDNLKRTGWESNTGYDKQAGRQSVKVFVSYHTQASAKREEQKKRPIIVCVCARQLT